MTEKEPQGDAASSQRPRSPRVPVEFALEVEGTDAAGNPFQTKATATKISRGGATIAIDVDVAVGSVVKLVPPFGGKLEAQVNGDTVPLRIAFDHELADSEDAHQTLIALVKQARASLTSA